MAFVDVIAATDAAGSELLGAGLLDAGTAATFGATDLAALGATGLGTLGSSVLGGAEAFGSGAGAVAGDTAAANGIASQIPGAVGAGPAPTAFAPTSMANMPLSTDVATNPLFTNTAGANAVNGTDIASAANTASSSSGLDSGFSKALNWMDNNRALTAGGVMLGANLLGLNKPTTFNTPTTGSGVNTNYFAPFTPQNFQPSRMPVTTNPVKPSYQNYVQNPYSPPQQMASGGIAGYADSNYEDLQKYENMISPRAASNQDPSWITNPTIPADNQILDQNTKSMSPVEAAKYRLAQAMAQAGMPTSSGIGLSQQTHPYGAINTDPAMVQQAQAQQAQQAQQTQNAASGGIMGYSLGNYASGGNPRLLSGPGDGMSDDIPATIGEKQPARLADGEFVVPADVVSHLGNGSTKAGADKLHNMMNKIRMDKTGTKKQAPQLKTDKYLPK